ncbi:MAG: DUF1538 domain-containing protein [Clostridia bacterium]|nr:DUF1538 domain-containing protein [Clostridia bacterium]
MRYALWHKIKEALISVLPVVLIVLVLCCTPLVELTGKEIGVFIVSAVFLIIGIGLFNLGADIAMSPIGDQVGIGLIKANKPWLVFVLCFALGLLITIAEPDLTLLAQQVSGDNPQLLVYAVGIGVGIFLVIFVIKIFSNQNLSSMLLFFYMLMFALAALLLVTGKLDYLSMAFDSGGVTTGPITVPFLMAFGVGISATVGGKNSAENSFGAVALCSIGPILAVLMLGLFSDGKINLPESNYQIADNIFGEILHAVGNTSWGVFKALGMIVLFFLVMQFALLKLPKRKLVRIAVGIAYTFVGLVVFLAAVEVGFMPIGHKLGAQLANAPTWFVVVAFVIGMVVVLAEPAVHVLNKQVEEVTDRAISKKSMLLALSIGVGISIGLSAIRIVFDFSILYYLIPGYILSLGLSFFVPRIYTAIAFDSGGVASGPLTSSFILPFAIGACSVIGGQDSILQNAFGVVAMVAMTPLITIQLLGFRAVVSQNVRNKIAQHRIISADDEQIINFM